MTPYIGTKELEDGTAKNPFKTYHRTYVVSRLWGLLWGCSFKLLVVWGEIESNAERMDLGDWFLLTFPKLAAVSKIARCVGTLSNRLSAFILIDLPSC